MGKDIMVPQYARRHHRKSKTGCLPCKARHAKCDELKPTCSGCERHQTSCVYRTVSSSTHSTKSSSPVHSTPPSASGSIVSVLTSAPPINQYPADGFEPLQFKDLRTLRLFHHFVTVTYLTVSHHPSHFPIWQVSIPQLAMQCPFLMHGILSLAALHLTSLDPSEASHHLLASTRHQDLALPAFREALNAVTEKNGLQVFCFSAMLVVHSIGQLCAVDSSNILTSSRAFHESKSALPPQTVESLFEWIGLLRGLQPVVETVGAWVQRSELGPMIEDPRGLPHHGFAMNPNDSRLEALSNLFTAPYARDEDLAAYRETLYELRQIFAVSFLPNLNINVRTLAFKWLVTLSKQFVALLEQRDPVAMILLAYYATFLTKVNSIWYLQGSASRLLGLCTQSLDEQNASWATVWLEYPTIVIKQAEESSDRRRAMSQ